jgi:hypothetical protein
MLDGLAAAKSSAPGPNAKSGPALKLSVRIDRKWLGHSQNDAIAPSRTFAALS